jgi:molybdate transport system substrate-binding protein
MILVKSSGSAEPALDHVAQAFRAATGQLVRVVYSAAIEDYDVLVASRDAVERKFRPSGKVLGDQVSLGRMSLGIAIRPGLPVPEIADVAALVRALEEADRIIITEQHTSGLYIETMLRDLGLLEALSAKIERRENGPRLMDRVLAGTGRELAFLSLNAIRTYVDRGLVLVGPLPEAVQLVREFVAIPAAGSAEPETARAFVAFCGGAGRPLLAAHGFD